MPYKIVSPVMDELTHEPYKVIVADLENHSKLESFRDKLDSKVSNTLNSVFSNYMLLEYGSKSATKGNSIINLCHYFDIPVENSIACGDEENDLTMIQTAGIGVAMNNATEHIKSHSDYITENDNNHHGIKEVIERFMIV
jgi:hydroxymethylpyrimidine pyrophosphatase-like HAD family hydrolase